METILVIVSVLSTLVIVAIVLSVVVILKTLKGKVEVVDFDGFLKNQELKEKDASYEIAGISSEIFTTHDVINNRIDREFEQFYREYESDKKENKVEFSGIHSTIDRRCDKLYDSLKQSEINLSAEVGNIIEELSKGDLPPALKEEIDRFKRDTEKKIEHLVSLINNKDKNLLTD